MSVQGLPVQQAVCPVEPGVVEVVQHTPHSDAVENLGNREVQPLSVQQAQGK